MAETGFIYALTDPRIDDPFLAVRYIGMTRQGLAVRLTKHLHEARDLKRDFYRVRWIRLLVAAGLKPGIVVLESVALDCLAARETEWIADYRNKGAQLTNATPGGEGNPDPSPEIRAKIGAKNRGRTASLETRAKISRAGLGRVHSAEARAHIGEGHRGLHPSEETRKKLSEGKFGNQHCRGHVHTAETIDKCRQAQIGNKNSLGHVHGPETREKLSTLNRGRVHSAEARRNMSLAHQGKKPSPETREKMSAALRARWARIPPEQERLL